MKMAYSGDDYCFGCGTKNPIGLHLDFKPEGDKVVAKKILAREYEGYANVAHGGIVTTLLDEAMGNFIQQRYDEQAMTGRLEVRYKYPTPILEELKITAWQESQRRNILTMRAQVETLDGKVTAEAMARFAVVSLK